MHTATEHPARYFHDRKFDVVSRIPVQRNNSGVGGVSSWLQRQYLIYTEHIKQYAELVGGYLAVTGKSISIYTFHCYL